MSTIWLLGVQSRDFFQAEKERIAWKAEQIHKMTTIFTQNDNLGPVKIVVIASFFFLSMRKIMCLNSQQPKTRRCVDHFCVF